MIANILKSEKLDVDNIFFNVQNSCSVFFTLISTSKCLLELYLIFLRKKSTSLAVNKPGHLLYLALLLSVFLSPMETHLRRKYCKLGATSVKESVYVNSVHSDLVRMKQRKEN